MEDGMKDASALHAADVGIPVDSAVDVAKEAADMILLEKDLGVLAEGVGVRDFSFTDRSCCSEPQTFLQEPAREVSIDGHPAHRRRHPSLSLHSVGWIVWI